jgi:secreted Zn-dependent insulinase-like peptidase
MGDYHELSITWYLPDYSDEFLESPFPYVSHVFGQSGKNSLQSFLKDQGLINSVSAYHDEGPLQNT